MPSFKSDVPKTLESLLLPPSSNHETNNLLEHPFPASDVFVHSPITKTPPPIEQPVNVIGLFLYKNVKRVIIF
jgi:hypothetical protein